VDEIGGYCDGFVDVQWFELGVGTRRDQNGIIDTGETNGFCQG
jgi:hypothetical protein